MKVFPCTSILDFAKQDSWIVRTINNRCKQSFRFPTSFACLRSQNINLPCLEDRKINHNKTYLKPFTVQIFWPLVALIKNFLAFLSLFSKYGLICLRQRTAYWECRKACLKAQEFNYTKHVRKRKPKMPKSQYQLTFF